MQKATEVFPRRRQVRTRRLELRPATEQSLRAELARDYDELAKLLQASVSVSWPPPLYDAAALEWTLAKVQSSPRNALWWAWYFIRRNPGGGRELIGAGGFKGPPAAGAVEIGYSIIEVLHGQEFGTEAAEGLVAWARACPRVRKVVAHTLAHLHASIRVLEKNGFRQKGRPEEPEAIRFELDLAPVSGATFRSGKPPVR